MSKFPGKQHAITSEDVLAWDKMLEVARNSRPGLPALCIVALAEGVEKFAASGVKDRRALIALVERFLENLRAIDRVESAVVVRQRRLPWKIIREPLSYFFPEQDK